MEIYTIGWNKGYQEGLMQGYFLRENKTQKKNSFKTDSLFMELHLSSKIK